MAKRDIVVIGASAGGVEAVSRLVAALPRDLPAAVFVTLHYPRNAVSVLPRILSRAGTLEAVHPTDGEAILPGRIYVAPPDWHLVVGRGHIHLVRGPTENGNRPAVDPMFRSAAIAHGARVVGIVVSGNLDDGTAGLFAIRRRGGVGIAQDPDEALFPSMPRSAVEHGVANHVVPIFGMPALLESLLAEDISIDAEAQVPDDARKETDFSRFDIQAIEDEAGHPGDPSPFSCPDCGGVLWAIQDDDLARYRCRVGHAWTQDGLLMQQTETVDTALWTALRALEENASLHRNMAKRASARGSHDLVRRFEENAEVSERRAHVIRQALASQRRIEVQRDASHFPPRNPDAGAPAHPDAAD